MRTATANETKPERKTFMILSFRHISLFFLLSYFKWFSFFCTALGAEHPRKGDVGGMEEGENYDNKNGLPSSLCGFGATKFVFVLLSDSQRAEEKVFLSLFFFLSLQGINVSSYITPNRQKKSEARKVSSWHTFLGVGGEWRTNKI